MDVRKIVVVKLRGKVRRGVAECTHGEAKLKIEENIRKVGQIVPVMVQVENGRIHLKAGLLRLRACEQIGRRTVTAVNIETGSALVLRIKDIVIDPPVGLPSALNQWV